MGFLGISLDKVKMKSAVVAVVNPHFRVLLSVKACFEIVAQACLGIGG